MTIEQKLRQIVAETFLVGDESASLQGDDSFIEKGLIDSTGILQLVEIVEQEFGFKVEDEDLIPENLDSINRLVAFVERKMLACSEAGASAADSASTASCSAGVASSVAD